VAIVGAGAAGTAIAKLLVRYGVGDVVVTDSRGILAKNRTDLNGPKRSLMEITNKENREGGVLEAIAGADVVIGVSGPGTVLPEQVQVMAQKPIVFALANPVPEIMPDEAKRAGASVVATGRSDFPNQINNVLVFPGIFRGALDHKVTKITDDMTIKAAKKLAGLVAKPTANKIIPAVFDKRVAKAIASVVR
jgi:malate dehydrogenase (oxaloacetate-decarboxylating)